MSHKTGFIWRLFIIALSAVACTAGIQQMSSAKTGASGVEQVCQQGGLSGCAALGGGFEKFALNDHTSARAHIYVMLSQNPSLDAAILAQALHRYAAMDTTNGTAVEQFASFVSAVAQEMTIARATIAAASPPNSVETPNTPNDNDEARQCLDDQCAYDSQCKLNRVCIVGECVSPKYAKAIEARAMEQRSIQPDNQPDNAIAPNVPLLVPSIETENVLCTPQKVGACMSRCEGGNKESCYAVAKVYENLPPAARRSEFILYAYNKACIAGMSEACIHLGRLYFEGNLVPRQPIKTFYNNTEACKLGNSLGCANAAVLQEMGVGVVKDDKAAEQYFAMACTLGHDESCTKVQSDQPIFVAPNPEATTSH